MRQLRQFQFLFFCLITFNLFADSSYVTAFGGLRMRVEPSPNGKVVITIPDGEEVTVIESQNLSQEIIGGRSGNWTKISYKGTEGWVFGGFLSKQMGACLSDADLSSKEGIFYMPSQAGSGDFYGGTITFKPEGTAKIEASGLRTGLRLEANWSLVKNAVKLEGTWGRTDEEIKQECSFGCQGEPPGTSCYRNCEKSSKNKGYSGVVTFLLKGPEKNKRKLNNPSFQVTSGPKNSQLPWNVTMISGHEECIREKK